MDIKYKITETGLYEENVFKLLTDYELTRAQRYPNPVSLFLVSLNLDQAKASVAKTLKKLVSGILNTSLRISDIPAHYGNDFVILTPATDEFGAQAVAMRLIARLRGSSSFSDGESFNFVTHIGIATHPGGKRITVEELLQQAESALQEAREAGPHIYKQ